MKALPGFFHLTSQSLTFSNNLTNTSSYRIKPINNSVEWLLQTNYNTVTIRWENAIFFFFPFKTTNWSETRKENSNTKELNSKEVRFYRPNFDLLATNWIKVKRCQLCGVRTYMVLNSSLWFWFSFRKRSSKISKRKLFVNLSFYCYFFCLLISFLFIHFIYLFFETLWSIAKSLT